MELDPVADELYAVPPDEFIALRTARRDQARERGAKPLAARIAALPKPTVAAWVCNLLVRARRSEIESLVELGQQLRGAQQELAGAELKALGVQRGRLLDALTRQAMALGRASGRPVGSGIAGQVTETLRAAMADPAQGELLLTGRLAGPLSYQGLGDVSPGPALRLVPTVDEEATGARDRGGAAAAGDARAPAAQRREQERAERRRTVQERHRREMERARAAAREAAEQAAEAAAVAQQQAAEVDRLTITKEELQTQVDALAEQLARAEHALAGTAATLKQSQRRRAAFDREAEAAAEERDRAAAQLARLEAADES